MRLDCFALRASEVADLGGPVDRHEDVFGLDVAVGDLLRVKVVEAVQNLSEEVRDLVEREVVVSAGDVFPEIAVAKLLDDHDVIRAVEDVDHLDDVLVVHALVYAEFGFEGFELAHVLEAAAGNVLGSEALRGVHIRDLSDSRLAAGKQDPGHSVWVDEYRHWRLHEFLT